MIGDRRPKSGFPVSIGHVAPGNGTVGVTSGDIIEISGKDHIAVYLIQCLPDILGLIGSRPEGRCQF